MAEMLSPFSPAALASLPQRTQRPARYTRADAIPDVTATGHEQPTVRDYHAINTVPEGVRVPKKRPTSVRVEGKVWFANERTWISWMSVSILIATLSVALFNASKDTVARNFAYLYAVISLAVMVYGYIIYQHRITMIRRRDPGHFDRIEGPLIVSAVLFVAVLVNFVIRAREIQRKGVPIPGSDFVEGLSDWFRKGEPLRVGSESLRGA